MTIGTDDRGKSGQELRLYTTQHIQSMVLTLNTPRSVTHVPHCRACSQCVSGQTSTG